MKFILLILFYLINFNFFNAQKRAELILSGLENQKFLLTKIDKRKLSKLNEERKIEEQKAKNKNSTLYCCQVDKIAEFKNGGAYSFRKIFGDKFKIPINVKKASAIFQLTIGKNDLLEKVRILKCNNRKIKKEIINVLNQNVFQNWESANIIGVGKVRYEFDITLEIIEK